MSDNQSYSAFYADILKTLLREPFEINYYDTNYLQLE